MKPDMPRDRVRNARESAFVVESRPRNIILADFLMQEQVIFAGGRGRNSSKFLKFCVIPGSYMF